MLTGAARAAERMGVRHLERVWVVALPVVVVLVLERLYTFIGLSWISLGPPTTPAALIVGRAGPLTLRTALVATTFAAAAWALVWTLAALGEFVRAVRAQGRRLLVHGGSTGRLFVLASLFSMLCALGVVHQSLPTSRDVIADARRSFSNGQWWDFDAAVICDVKGIRALCREGIEHETRANRLMAAMALRSLVGDSPETTAILRSLTREELRVPENQDLMQHLAVLRGGGWGSMFRWSPHVRDCWEQFRRECIP